MAKAFGIAGRGTKSEYQKRQERSDLCTDGILDNLADGLFQDSIKRMDERFNQGLGDFISGHHLFTSIRVIVVSNSTQPLTTNPCFL